MRFLSDVCLRSQMVHRRAHVQWLAVGVEYADVYSQPIVVQASAVGGVRHIVLLRRAFHGVPHFLLYGQRAGGVVDDEAVGGMFLAEQLLCLEQALQGVGVEIGFAQVGVEPVKLSARLYIRSTAMVLSASAMLR